ncbi:hypothetical protein MRS44_018411 [Fusarium solani]|uniref:uncharacterized protein n=1 Tax=Fusarium solani TaxID=169388 RepID=UPI0032C402ED|nr:hypothetical protein MRS44_018411 [Fusarium solani]
MRRRVIPNIVCRAVHHETNCAQKFDSVSLTYGEDVESACQPCVSHPVPHNGLQIGQKSDVAHTTKKLRGLLELLESLRQQLERLVSQADDHGILANMNSCMEDCKELIRDLEAELNKFNQAPNHGTIRTTGRQRSS